MNPKSVAEFLRTRHQPPYRVRQTLQALCSGASAYSEVSTLPLPLRKEMDRDLPLLSFVPKEVRSAPDGSAHKAGLRLVDGLIIETVLMRNAREQWSVCVSSQAGCALKCSFCATGLMGHGRNLSFEEITDQVLFWRQWIKKAPIPLSSRISNVVYMGMGEPMLNFDQVRRSIEELADPELFGMARRAIAVSTVGIPSGIERFARECPQVHLALSLHAADNPLRDRLAPVNKAYPLERLIKALRYYFERNNRRVFLEYVLLAGENDAEAHAKGLVGFVDKAGSKHLFHVNLIVWNPTSTPHRATGRDTAIKFRNYLTNRGVSASIRKNIGQEISGACGQLIVSKK